MTDDEILMRTIRATIVTALGLEIGPEEIDVDAPLFDGSFGFDSVDMVTCIVAVERRFSVEFPDDADFPNDFRCVADIARAITAIREPRRDAK